MHRSVSWRWVVVRNIASLSASYVLAPLSKENSLPDDGLKACKYYSNSMSNCLQQSSCMPNTRKVFLRRVWCWLAGFAQAVPTLSNPSVDLGLTNLFDQHIAVLIQQVRHSWPKKPKRLITQSRLWFQKSKFEVDAVMIAKRIIPKHLCMLRGIYAKMTSAKPTCRWDPSSLLSCRATTLVKVLQ